MYKVCTCTVVKLIQGWQSTAAADPDLELKEGRGGGGGGNINLLALLAFYPSINQSINQLYLKHGKWLSKLVFRHAV